MKRIILLGRAGAGKDFLRKFLESKGGLEFQVSYTTRPPRPNEIHGQDYFFITEDEFSRLSQEKAWHERANFNNWNYGTLKSQFNAKDNALFIMSPEGLQHLTKKELEESFLVYLNILKEEKNKAILIERLRARNWDETQIQTRLQADDLQFSKYKLDKDQPGIEVTDPFFNPSELLSKIKAFQLKNF